MHRGLSRDQHRGICPAQRCHQQVIRSPSPPREKGAWERRPSRAEMLSLTGHPRLFSTRMRATVNAFALAALATSLAAGAEPASTSTNAPVKTYRNPLLPDREIADPFVLRVEGKYYLYPTTDSRGYEVFVSDDLVHWERKARAFSDPRGGDWAPEVFYNKRGDGKYYLYYTDNMPGPKHGPFNKQIGVAVAESPLGPFADKGPLATQSIDADLFQDDDGSLYLYYVELADGFKILVQPMEDPLSKKGEPKVVIRPTRS